MTRVKTFGTYDEATYQQILNCAGEDGLAVLCADNHLGYSQPIGGVVAYEDYVSPSGVGFDIGCGNKAVRTDISYADLGRELHWIMNLIFERISFGMGRKASSKADHEVLDKISKAEVPLQRGLATLARDQLGTVGGGNHYVDLFRDEDEYVWVGVHFGSRGFGHKTASNYMDEKGGMMAPPTLLSTESLLGQEYIEAMTLAGAYAYAGRDVVIDQVLSILGNPAVTYEVHNHHNFAWRESHFGKDYWVVRKGATPAFPGQQGFVGGSMGDISVILEGQNTPESAEGLYSTVHGAGRQMSRTEAKGKVRRRWSCVSCLWTQGHGEPGTDGGPCPACGWSKTSKIDVTVQEGRIDWRTVRDELVHERGIEIRGGDADEAPGAYKYLPEVLAAHGDTIKVLHTLYPIGVAMAGPDVKDFYKD